MADIKGKVRLMSAASALLVPGPCRLFGAAISVISSPEDEAGGQIYPEGANYLLSDTTVEMKNGSGGDVLFSFAIPVGKESWSCGRTPFVFMFGNGYIEFDSGIYIEQWTDHDIVGKPDSSETNLYVYYEGA